MLIRATSPTALIVEELGAELVVYDRGANTAHLLDERAASIFKACSSGIQLDDLLPLAAGEGEEERRAFVCGTLRELERAGLVVTEGAQDTLTRRSLLGSLSRAASMPLIISILAPTPAAAATCGALPPLCPTNECFSGDCIELAECTAGCVTGGGVMGCCAPGNDTKTDGCPCTDASECCSNFCDGDVCAADPGG